MLKLASLIRAEKHDVELGPWKTGKIPASSFPLKKSGRFQSGSDWEWRLITFTALGVPCRLLIRLNEGKQQYLSILGIEDEGQLKVVCHHELHTSHRGWHCHYVPGDIKRTFPGVLRDRDLMRVLEQNPSQNVDDTFNFVKASAISIAAKRFRFEGQNDNSKQLSLI